MRTTIRILCAAATIALGVGSVTAHAVTAKAAAPAAVDPSSATLLAYTQDPVAIYDDTGSKVRTIPKKEMPQVNTPAAKVVNTKTGFVAIILDGKPAWLRLSQVQYTGNLPSPKCEKGAVQLAFNEDDGVDRSLGLGCGKPK